MAVEGEVRRMKRRTRHGERSDGRGPTRILPRAARTTTCADRRRSSRPGASARRTAGASGSIAAGAPYAPSTWNQSRFRLRDRRQLAQRIDRGRADRARPCRRRWPDENRRARSRAICSRRASVAHRQCCSPPGMDRIASSPNPQMSGRLLEPGVHLAPTRRREHTPRAVHAVRSQISLRPVARVAATKHTRFATFPPLTMMPPESAGKPISSATHRTVCRSISVATGDNAQAPQFALKRRREQVGERADRRRRRRDVAKEPGMPVER